MRREKCEVWGMSNLLGMFHSLHSSTVVACPVEANVEVERVADVL